MNLSEATICVFAASSERIHPRYVEEAYKLGQLLAAQGATIVNGAGARGLMRAVSDGSLDAGGRVTGVIPKFMVDNNWQYDRLSELIITPDMHERKRQMSLMSQAVVALPGGIGTLEELLEALTWRQLGIAGKPCVLLNTRGYYNPLLSMLRTAIDEGFMKPSHSRLLTVVDTAAEAIDALRDELAENTFVIESKY
ncbi:MAG: TIGR00730 family Rossman fold protein [Muribaculaceae bacterium]|nr:TIGR00730 family Rossman fold protein [Muribaculaceae bacterium]